MKKNEKSKKNQQLCDNGTLNPHPDKVYDSLFETNNFFDPHDHLQVKYEMLRKVVKEGCSVSQAAKNFGFSRRHYYDLLKQYNDEGLKSLVGEKPGPKGAHKLTPSVMKFVNECLQNDSSLKASQLCKLIEEQFLFSVHPRSIERAIYKMKKKRERH